MMDMNVGIVGGGAMGQFLYTQLQQKHLFCLTLYTRTKEQANQVSQQGIYLYNGNQRKHYSAIAESIDKIKQTDVLIVTLKQYALKKILPILYCQEFQNTTLVFLQNGMGHLEEIEKLPQSKIYVGTVSHGVTKVHTNEIIHKGIGPILFGRFRGIDNNFENHMLTFNQEKFPLQFLSDFQKVLLDKLYINAVINPLTALLNVKNGALIQNENFREMAHSIFEELDLVFSFQEKKEEVWHSIVQVIQATAHNESSMLQDLKNNKLTEIDGIYGYIMREANKKEKDIRYIPFLYNAISGLERRNLQ